MRSILSKVMIIFLVSSSFISSCGTTSSSSTPTLLTTPSNNNTNSTTTLVVPISSPTVVLQADQNNTLKDQIVGTWQDTTNFLDIDPNSAFYEFREDGTVVIPGANGQYIITEDQKKIQINLSSGAISRTFTADISIEGGIMRWNINNPREFLRIPEPTVPPAGVAAPTVTPIVLEVVLKRVK